MVAWVRCVLAGVAALSPVGFSLAQQTSGTLAKIARTKVITIGHRDAALPFSFLGEDRRPKGYAVELCERVAAEAGKTLGISDIEIRYALVTAQSRIQMVVDGAVDMECGSTTNTFARQQQVDFSATYFTTGTRVLVRKAYGAREIEDLKGKTIALVTGSTNERVVKALLASGDIASARALEVKDYAEGMSAFEAGNADAFATDDVVLYGLIAKTPKRADYEVTGRFLSYDPYGVMMRRDDSSFRLVVNRTLASLFRSREIETIYAKWFDPIGVPLDPLLKAAFAIQAIPE